MLPEGEPLFHFVCKEVRLFGDTEMATESRRPEVLPLSKLLCSLRRGHLATTDGLDELCSEVSKGVA